MSAVSHAAFFTNPLPQLCPQDGHSRPIWLERHYSPKELGEVWGMSHDSIIRLFKNEPGVIKTCPPHRRGVRKRVTYRIPESVATRVYSRCRNQ